MSDEIKEILDKLKETADYPKLNYSSYDKSYNETIDNVAMIKSFACKQLLDYITNLQQENEQLEKIANSRMNTLLKIEQYCIDEKEDLISGGEVCEDVLKIIDESKGK